MDSCRHEDDRDGDGTEAKQYECRAVAREGVLDACEPVWLGGRVV